MPCIADEYVSVSGGPLGAATVGDELADMEGDEDGAVEGANGEGEVEAGAVGAADVQEYKVTATTKVTNAVGERRA
jgi:hypothetical protein